MATIYKKFTIEEMNSRSTVALSSDDNTAVNNVVTDFITFFKAKHS
jgi:hypothetical protein